MFTSKVVNSELNMRIEREPFGQTADGIPVDQFILTNQSGTTLKLMNYGASIRALEIADKNGVTENIVLGFDSVRDYEGHDGYFGATIGRVCNRIANGRFTLDDKSYQLVTNNDPSHLHGGYKGFDKVIWKAQTLPGSDEVGVCFSYTSKDGEEGYPGNLAVSVLFSLSKDDELRIEYKARTDAKTVVNLTNHTYWNLSGRGSETVLEHRLQIQADAFLATDARTIPTVARAVSGSEMDFTTAHTIGERIAALKADPDGSMGYDHNYILRGELGELNPAALLEDPSSGRIMEVLTTEPGVHLYTGNFLDGTKVSGGYPQHAALCLETQHFPDSPNRPDFPSVILEPGALFHSATVFRFSTQHKTESGMNSNFRNNHSQK